MTRRPHIVLGVSGGIAAYKAAELVRLLVKADRDVQVVMTRAAAEFITPLTLQTLSGRPVLSHLFESEAAGPETWAPDEIAGAPGAQARNPSGIEHIDVIKDADLVVVAPATADVLAKAAHGLAGDALTTVLLAAGPRILYAPAMNHRMWNHPATRANVALLASRGALFVEPGAGYQACGETGVGRMAEPAEILAAVEACLARRRDLAGRSILVSAGRTEEPVDPVRVLTNRSSGRMGVAIAEEARDRGARVVLVAGALSVPLPAGVEIESAPTAEAMHTAVLRRFADADVLVMAAAVADFRPADPQPEKIRRASGFAALPLAPTADIVKEAAAGKRPDQLVVAFALETTNGMQGAERKLSEKGLDMVVLNNPTEPGSEFGGETNQVTFLVPGARPEAMPLSSKREVARALLDRVASRLGRRGEGR